MVAPPACVLGCGRKFLFCRWSSTPPKNWRFLGRLLVSQNAANIVKRHADQTQSEAPRPVGLLHRISTGTPVLCAFRSSDLPHSPHDITQPLRTKPHPTYSSPHPPLVPSTPQSRPSTQRARNFCSIVFPKYSSQSRARARTSLTAEWALRSVNPQPWRFTNNSLGVPHAQSFSVCLSS